MNVLFTVDVPALGARIRQARNQKNLSLEEVARWLEVKPETLRKIETEETQTMHLPRLVRLDELLGTKFAPECCTRLQAALLGD